jgi:hypothetical protein
MNDQAPIPFSFGPPGAGGSDTGGIEEIVLCGENGEILYEWPSPGTGNRAQLFDPLFKFSDALAQALSLGRATRLEVDTMKGRLFFVLNPNRRLLVRSSNKRPKA